MDWTYTVQKVEENEFANGIYDAQIRNVYRKIWNGHTAIVIQWKMISPEDYIGKSFFQYLMVDHPNELTKDIARESFNKICSQVKEIPIGQQLTEQDLFNFLLGKDATITLNTKQGSRFTNVTKVKFMEPVVYGMSLPQKPDPASPKAILNDDIPF